MTLWRMPVDRISTSLYCRFVAVVNATPGLSRYRRQIIGSCCKPPTDPRLKANIKAFIIRAPQFREALEPLIGDAHA